MLTRRGFTAFAPCAICASVGLVATDALAQNAPAATTGIKRTVLSQTDGPAPVTSP